MCPFVPIDCIDERSCYSILLMHTPWPEGGELNIVAENLTAVEQLAYVMTEKLMPEYVQPMLNKIQMSQNIRSNNGRPTSVGTNDLNIGEDENGPVEESHGDYNDLHDSDNDNEDDEMFRNGTLVMIDSINKTAIIEGTRQYYI